MEHFEMNQEQNKYLRGHAGNTQSLNNRSGTGGVRAAASGVVTVTSLR
jgi:hypothetical protein